MATITAGFNPMAIAVDPTTNTVYAPLLADGEHAGNVAVINGATCNAANRLRTRPPKANTTMTISATVDPKTHNVYVTNVQDASVSVIDGTTCNGTDTAGCSLEANHKVSVDDYPVAVAVAPGVGTAYVTSAIKGTVTVVRLQQGSS